MGLITGINIAKNALTKTGRILQTKPQNLDKISLSGLRPDLDFLVLSEKNAFWKNLTDTHKTSKVYINNESFTKAEYSQMGSNPAFWAKNDKTGKVYYVKLGRDKNSKEHLKSEATAAKLYNLAGIETPKMELSRLEDGTECLLSEYASSLQKFGSGSAFYDGFGADAWLANWDAMVAGNTFLKNGKSFKIDCGGALNFRAQGRRKTDFGEEVKELVTLVDGRNIDSFQTYGNMKQKDIIASLKKITSVSDDAIQNTVNDNELAEILIKRKKYIQRVLNKVEKRPVNDEDLGLYFKRIEKELEKEKEEFSKNWNAVLEHISAANRKPQMKDWLIKEEKYNTFSDEEKVLAAYITEDFSDSANKYFRNGCETDAFDWWAKKGLDHISLPKYRDALKYAMDGLESSPGTTYRWQPAGSFSKDYNVYKTGQKIKIDVEPENPYYMSLKRSRLQNIKSTPKEGDILEYPTFVSTGRDIHAVEYFRKEYHRVQDPFSYNPKRVHPELIIINGKRGKSMPAKVAGYRAFEHETLYAADTQYRYLGEKTITSPDEIPGLAKELKESDNGAFQKFKAIYLEEI